MHGEYGYMEEDQLGKAYNFRLLKRLARYAFPYKRIIALALLLTILMTLLDLALPYLSKIAIDRYILGSWYKIDLFAMDDTEISPFVKRYGHLLEKTGEGASEFLIHQTDLRKIDPALVHRFRTLGIVSEQRFYKTDPESLNRLFPEGS